MSGGIAAVLYGLYRVVIGRWMGQKFRTAGPVHHQAKGFVPTGTGIIMALLLLVAGILVIPSVDTEVAGTRLGIYVC